MDALGLAVELRPVLPSAPTFPRERTLHADLGKGRRRGTSPMRGRKVAIKYRDKAGNTWAGRGAQPRWLTAAIKAGAKRDDFLVDKSAGKTAKKVRKKRRAKK